MLGGDFEVLLALFLGTEEGIADGGFLDVLVVLHGNPGAFGALEDDGGNAVVLIEGGAHPLGRVGLVGVGAFHVDAFLVVGQAGGGFHLAGVPGGVLDHEIPHEFVFALGGGEEPAAEAAGFIGQPAQRLVDDLLVGGVMADEDELAETMVDERAADLVDNALEGVAGEGDGAHAVVALAHVVGGIPEGHQGGEGHLSLLGGP
ncbi:hypothetical protein TRIP_E200057 [uncultured Spirochaetota bacterium]|nr:hypothetical protein TRIP_E200057 [uncultured Spirochaetota bacterium]